ncbi:hypothetical protein BST61_g8278 [Cercospora zeina]
MKQTDTDPRPHLDQTPEPLQRPDPNHDSPLLLKAHPAPLPTTHYPLHQQLMLPILYDSFTFPTTERSYDTYKRELKAVVTFAEKHAPMSNGPQKSTIMTDHEPL